MERNWSGAGEHREVIQIGAVRMEGPSFAERDSFMRYMRPRKNPQLSDFIIELTHITQADIDTKGVPFQKAVREFLVFVGKTPAYCWGSDVLVLRENAELNKIELSLPDAQFRNIRPLMAPAFSKAGIDIDMYTSGTLISAFGVVSTRRAHDALNDMRNLAGALRELTAGGVRKVSD